MPRRYVVSYPDAPDDFPATTAIAVAEIHAEIVAEDFAIRLSPLAHPGGIPDLLLAHYTLDHIASGLRVYTGGYDECRLFAESIATMPIDWSQPEISQLLLEPHFIDAARAAARGGESIGFEDFAAPVENG
jgi:hypothetical protein